uniref:Alkylated DNA repair protein AlkB homologue 8 N-terminal domain-containing protein n=1 Tax=Knipowitschia caucasica TaxID=637954 RepID=A0AAV2MG93_KNICA
MEDDAASVVTCSGFSSAPDSEKWSSLQEQHGNNGYDCALKLGHDSVKLIKFADDTTLIGLISDNDESAYRREVDRLVSWCSGSNLELNAQKTVEMIVDFRKSTVPPPPPSVMGTTITQDLKWEPTISSLIKKAQQRMYFLRQLRKAKLPAQMLVQFYTPIIESILTSSITSSITVWFAGATVRDKQRLQCIVRCAEEVIGRSLPSLQDLVVLGAARCSSDESVKDAAWSPDSPNCSALATSAVAMVTLEARVDLVPAVDAAAVSAALSSTNELRLMGACTCFEQKDAGPERAENMSAGQQGCIMFSRRCKLGAGGER